MSAYSFLKCPVFISYLLYNSSQIGGEFFVKNKEYALTLLKATINAERKITYIEIAELSGYSEKQIRRFSKEIENKDIDSMLIHASTGEPSHNSASDSEIQYLKDFKKQYPKISISQFMDIYHEDIIFNPKISIVTMDMFLLENIDVSKEKTLILYVSLHLEEVF